jgi:hypothetical protein
MNDSQEHIFTNEFDDLSVVISLDFSVNPATMQITISESRRVWDERIPISLDSFHHEKTR